MWHIYILQCKDRSLYTGITKDVTKRFAVHKSGKGGAYTLSHPPVKIVYTEKTSSRSRALKREIEIKKLSRQEKLWLTKKSSSNRRAQPYKYRSSLRRDSNRSMVRDASSGETLKKAS